MSTVINFQLIFTYSNAPLTDCGPLLKSAAGIISILAPHFATAARTAVDFPVPYGPKNSII